MRVTTEISHLRPHQIRPFVMDGKTTDRTLQLLGVHIPKEAGREFAKAYGFDSAAMDVAPNMITTPSTVGPIQFYQYWLPGPVELVTTRRDIDDIIGRTQAGTWADEEIVQPIVEKLGQAQPYGDKNNIPLASWNANYERRSIVRYELGLEVGILEEEQSARVLINSADFKRRAVATALDIERNLVGFNGFNDGTNATYGLLNDPNMGAYYTVPENAAGTSTKWQDKTFTEIAGDIILMVTRLQNQTGGNWMAPRDRAVLAISLQESEWLNKPNQFGKSAMQWLQETYPNIRIVQSPFLNGANGGESVAYLIADELAGQRVIDQYTQDVLRFLGIEKKAKGFVEDYANATAGVMLKLPIGLVRYTGI